MRAFLGFLLAAAAAGSTLLTAGCAGRPDDSTLGLWERLAFLFMHYNKAFESGDPARVQLVASDLQRLAAAHMDTLTGTVSSGTPERQGDAAFALGFSKSTAAVAPLAELTKSPVPEVRSNAIASLGMLGFEEVPSEPFQRLLEDREYTVRLSALFGLRPLLHEKNDRGLLEAIHRRLTDPVIDVRNEAVILLGKLRRKESIVPLLSGPAVDREPLIRRNVAVTLRLIGREAAPAAPHLIEMLRDELPGVVEEAWKALNEIHGKDLDRSYHTWRDWFEDEQRHVYECLDHKDVAQPAPGVCPKCGKRLERIPRDEVRKPERPDKPEASQYHCPDHPENIAGTPTKCARPNCGKDFVPKKPDPITYTCPDHVEIGVFTPSTCGKCGKQLVPKK